MPQTGFLVRGGSRPGSGFGPGLAQVRDRARAGAGAGSGKCGKVRAGARGGGAGRGSPRAGRAGAPPGAAGARRKVHISRTGKTRFFSVGEIPPAHRKERP